MVLNRPEKPRASFHSIVGSVYVLSPSGVKIKQTVDVDKMDHAKQTNTPSQYANDVM